MHARAQSKPIILYWYWGRQAGRAPYPLFIFHKRVRGERQVVKLLFDRGANIDAKNNQALTLASNAGKLHIVRVLIDRGAILHATGGMAILKALARGHIQIAKFLLSRGAEIDPNYKLSHEAFLRAVKEDQADMLHLLLEHGFDVNSKDGIGSRDASKYRHIKMVELLLKNDANINASERAVNALHNAAAFDHGELLQLLLREGAEINYQEGKWSRMVQDLYFQGKTGSVECLLDAGGDVNTKGGTYGSLLQAAVWDDNIPLVLKLLGRGANVHVRGGKYGTLLGTATSREDCKLHLLKLLIDEYEADVNAHFHGKFTPLQYAISRGFDHAVQTFLVRGADINLGRWLHNLAVRRAPESYRSRAKIMLKM